MSLPRSVLLWGHRSRSTFSIPEKLPKCSSQKGSNRQRKNRPHPQPDPDPTHCSLLLMPKNSPKPPALLNLSRSVILDIEVELLTPWKHAKMLCLKVGKKNTKNNKPPSTRPDSEPRSYEEKQEIPSANPLRAHHAKKGQAASTTLRRLWGLARLQEKTACRVSSILPLPMATKNCDPRNNFKVLLAKDKRDLIHCLQNKNDSSKSWS